MLFTVRYVRPGRGTAASIAAQSGHGQPLLRIPVRYTPQDAPQPKVRAHVRRAPKAAHASNARHLRAQEFWRDIANVSAALTAWMEAQARLAWCLKRKLRMRACR